MFCLRAWSLFLKGGICRFCLIKWLCKCCTKTFLKWWTEFCSVWTGDDLFLILDLCIQISRHILSIYSSLRKNSNALHSLLKRVVSTFSKDTGELASSFLEFMRQILNSDTMVSVHICICMYLLFFKFTNFIIS